MCRRGDTGGSRRKEMYKIVLQERRGEEMHQGQVCDRGQHSEPTGG